MKNLQINPLEKFKKFYKVSSSDPLTKRMELLDAISLLDESATSYKTSNLRLCNFENALYVSTFKGTNPLLDSQIMPKNLQLGRHTIGIFFALYQFFTEAGYLSYKTEADKSSGMFSLYTCPKYQWQIPCEFMPIFLSCIIATSRCIHPKKEISCDSFFVETERTFIDALPHYFNIPESFGNGPFLKALHDWFETYLDRSFFHDLENMVQNYSNTMEHKKLLLNSVDGLITLLLENTPHKYEYSVSVHKLLSAYIKKLDRQELSNLYPQEIPWVFHDEQAFINEFFFDLWSKVEDTYNSIYDFIVSHRLVNSKYEVAVDDPENISQKINSLIEELLSYSGMVRYFLYNYFKASVEHQDVQPYVQASILTIQHKNIKKHINTYESIVFHFVDILIKRFTSFKKKVELASSAHPERYRTLNVGESMLMHLQEDLTYTKSALEKKLKDTEKRLPSPLIYHQRGFVESEINYSFSYDFADIQNIVFILSQKPLSSETLIQSLSNRGYTWPMNIHQLSILLKDKIFFSQL